MQRLGRNHGKYLGETIDIKEVLRDVGEEAVKFGWTEETFLETKDVELISLARRLPMPGRQPVRIYISTGIHGDEPAGPLAALQLLRENRWPGNAELWLCPCLNPTGFEQNTRENAKGIDLNRQYLQTEAEEVRAHIAWLEKQPAFDVSLCLHEDWESHGFYVYELNPENRRSYAKEIVRRVAEVCPIDMSPVIEDRPAANGIITPNVDPRSRPQWPEAFYLLTHKTRLSYTLEAPSDFPMEVRVAALVAGVRAVLDSVVS